MLLERISPLLNAFSNRCRKLQRYQHVRNESSNAHGSIKNKHKPDTVGNTLGIQSMSGIGANGGI